MKKQNGIRAVLWTVLMLAAVRQRLRCCCIQFTRRDVACQARGGKIAPLYKAHPKSDRKV